MSTEQKPITVSEFKSWLQGIRDMLGQDWVPTAEQWKRICEKIDMLKDTPQQAVQPAVTYSRPITMEMSQPPISTPNALPARPAGPSSLAAPPMMPQLPQMVSSPGGMPVLKGPFTADNPASPVKTPTIDTSNGKYDSSFV